MPDLYQKRPALVAFSGGVDSTFVAVVAFEALRRQALAMTGVSPSVAPSECVDATGNPA